ncbi:MAG: rRNA pseudouridine synthase [Oscillospiraceae bacterium]|nr:rRNA pseudouridine synthase [Oscillospiraceae bacterium]
MNKKIRIQKALSENGLMSRREAEKAILDKKIKINGRVAQLGAKIDPMSDVVHIESKKIDLKSYHKNIYIMMYKPRGYVTTTKDELGRKCVMDLLKDIDERVYPIGRLDKISEGLLLFTNDGEFANFMMHPSSNILKTYRVTVRNNITDEHLIKLATGVVIDSGKTHPADLRVISKEENRSVFNITISEGKNRQIRKMCEAVGLNIIRLKRISIGSLKLGMLKPGQYKYLTPEEIRAIKSGFKKNKK